MPREAEPSINEREFVLEALASGTRLDGRGLDEARELNISFGDEDGVADVRLGESRVLTKITASITAPYPERKFDGIFTITSELSPLASPAFESGRSSELETQLSTALDTLLRRSNAISTESLCLAAGKQVWHLRATVNILAQHGSILSCASISLLAALAHYRILATEIKGGELTIFSASERDPVPLALLHHPVAMCMAFFDQGNQWILDPTLIEEQCCNHGYGGDAYLLVGANVQGEVLMIEKAGGLDVDARLVLGVIAVGVQRIKDFVQKVTDALKQDEQQRDKGGLGAELKAANDR